MITVDTGFFKHNFVKLCMIPHLCHTLSIRAYAIYSVTNPDVFFLIRL